jgi:hypothetical protein
MTRESRRDDRVFQETAHYISDSSERVGNARTTPTRPPLQIEGYVGGTLAIHCHLMIGRVGGSDLRVAEYCVWAQHGLLEGRSPVDDLAPKGIPGHIQGLRCDENGRYVAMLVGVRKLDQSLQVETFIPSVVRLARVNSCALRVANPGKPIIDGGSELVGAVKDGELDSPWLLRSRIVSVLDERPSEAVERGAKTLECVPNEQSEVVREGEGTIDLEDVQVFLGFEIYAEGEWLTVGMENRESFRVDGMNVTLCPAELGPSVMKVRRHTRNSTMKVQ